MKFRDKMKDVELSPYMLAIYRDNEHRHLLKHALECWEYRTRGGKNALGTLNTNPIFYSSYPTLELIAQYNISARSMLDSRVLKCPIVAKWALINVLSEYQDLPEMFLQLMQAPSQYAPRVVNLIDFDDDLIYKVIMSGLGPYMPEKFQNSLDAEQRTTMVICA